MARPSYRVFERRDIVATRVQAHFENLRQIQRNAVYVIDIEQAVNRSIRGPYAEEISFVVGQFLLQLTRQVGNPQQLLRSQLQHVAYSLGSLSETKNSDTQSSLLRHYWPNCAQDSPTETQKLMRHLKRSSYVCWTKKGSGIKNGRFSMRGKYRSRVACCGD